MKVVYKQDLKVMSSWLDTNTQLGLVGSLQVVQDNMCEYFKKIGSDGPTMIPVCNSFFVVTKTKICFNKFLNWLDGFSLISEVASKTRVKVNLCTDIVASNGQVVASCVQEMCPIDATLRNIRMINSTLFPQDLEPTKTTDISFQRMLFELDEEDFVFEKIVDISNLDFYKHTNNVEYVKFMLSALDLEFVSNMKINDFEIHYISESRFGDKLKVYRRFEENSVLFEIKRNGELVVKGKMDYVK